MMAAINRKKNVMNRQDLPEWWIDRQPIQDGLTDLAFSQNNPGKIPESGEQAGATPGTGIEDVGIKDNARPHTILPCPTSNETTEDMRSQS